jgi:DNA helicase II / ATP-dependent DNA helicase PcrA
VTSAPESSESGLAAPSTNADAIARLVDGLDAEQRLAVLVDAQPLAIIAGAGAGKTGVLTKRIMRRALDESADMRHVLAITFTRKAAAELSRRLVAGGMRERATVGTFHGVAWSVLQQRATDLGRRPPQLLTSRTSLVRELMAPHYGDVAEVTTEIDWARARRITSSTYAAETRRHNRNTRLSAAKIAEHFDAYEQRKKQKRLADFDDLLELLLREIERDRAFAAVQHWRFRHLFVDEFQDINPLQLNLLEAWRGERSDLCVVGDPSQSIYGWNGSDPDVLRHIENHIPGTTVVRLSSNHRSTPQIVEAAQRILGANAPVAIPRRLADGPEPLVVAFPDDTAEGPGIVSLLDRLRGPGRRWSSCAVLARTNQQLVSIEKALTDAGVPTRRRAGRALFDHPAVRRVLADDALLLRGWIEEMQARLNDRDTAATTNDAKTVTHDKQSDDAVIRNVIERAFEHLHGQPDATIGTFRMAMTMPDEFRFDGVDLLSFHAAKGLEWDTVVLAGIEKGYVPHSGSTTSSAREEETRLFYVAVTRATRQLIVTWCERRGPAPRQPSPLLSTFVTTVEPVTPPPPDLPLRRRSKATDPALESLRTWRASTARAARISPDVVLSDKAIAAIATARPVDESALALIEGVGPMAAHRFAPAILAALHLDIHDDGGVV